MARRQGARGVMIPSTNLIKRCRLFLLLLTWRLTCLNFKSCVSRQPKEYFRTIMRWRVSGAALVVLARPTNGNKGLARWSSSGTGGTDFLTEIPSNIFRFGSGCYNYICAAGLLHIMVRDISYSCGFQGQKIPIQLKVKTFSIFSCILCQYKCLSHDRPHFPSDGFVDPQWVSCVPFLQLPLCRLLLGGNHLRG